MKITYILATASICLTLVSCGPAATPLPSKVKIVSTAKLEGLATSISDVSDDGPTSEAARQVRLELKCPGAGKSPDCAAEAARSVFIWLDAHGQTWGQTKGRPDQFLVNVQPSGGSNMGYYQLIARDVPAGTLDDANVEETLKVFRWNGGGDEGTSEAALWCKAGHGNSAFCKDLKAEACNPVAPAAVRAIC